MDLLTVFLAFLWVVYIWETYLDIRQYRKHKDHSFPKELHDLISEEKFVKSQKYGEDKAVFGFVTSFISQVESTLILWFGGLPLLWGYSISLAQRFGLTEDYEVTISLIFMSLATLYEMVIHLPFELYSNFVIEERHGFNKLTLSLFFVDKVKGILLGIVLGLPAISGLIHLIQWGGPHFYVYAWLFVSLLILFMMMLYPSVIAPLFNTFTPIEGELKEGVEQLAGKIHFPLTKLFMIDGSKRSGHSNAYFFGLFKSKQIVLYDTLVSQCSQDEVLGVLSHELGHWYLNHTLKLLLISELNIFVSFFLFGQIIHWNYMYTSFGFSSRPVFIGMLLFFQFVMSPVDHLLNFLMNALSRRFEFQADAFSIDLGYSDALQSGLKKISAENLGSLCPDPLYSQYHDSHPPILQRLQAIQQLSKKEK